MQIVFNKNVLRPKPHHLIKHKLPAMSRTNELEIAGSQITKSEVQNIDTAALRSFAQDARKALIDQVLIKIEAVLASDSLARRVNPEAVKFIEKAINPNLSHGLGVSNNAQNTNQAQLKNKLAEKVAYTLFNRFCALRFMDLNNYNAVKIVSPATESEKNPEILKQAESGIINDILISKNNSKDQITGLLNGSIKSLNNDQLNDAYCLLIINVCNYYHKLMPYLFEPIDDYTELLMPSDLLSQKSILAQIRQVLTPQNCNDVEVIGWLYQYYIAERKDEIFAGFKSNVKASADDIPAATQLFTPHWIVKYLVENSLGRLWLLNHPQSKLASKMEYYIKPDAAETDFIKITDPEELKICDPACGSGHMLTYAFDLLYAIYEELGYSPQDISALILKNNLYGIEIDERASQLANFALTMKARKLDKNFFKNPIQPNICLIENVSIDSDKLKKYFDYLLEIPHFNDLNKKYEESHQQLADGKESGKVEKKNTLIIQLTETIRQFKEAKNYGTLLRPKFALNSGFYKFIKELDLKGDLINEQTQKLILKVLNQVDYLTSLYHVIVANPPYMGNRNMEGNLTKFAETNYEDTKTDLFAMFIERGLELVIPKGYSAMVTMQSWMFLISFDNLRNSLLNNTILNMAHLGSNAFDSISGEVTSVTAFSVKRATNLAFKGSYLRLIKGKCELDKNLDLLTAIKNQDCGWFYKANAEDFRKIPGYPIAYWVSDNIRQIFENTPSLGDFAKPRQGLSTANNDKFLRLWPEVSINKIGFGLKSIQESIESKLKWFPYNKGGEFRKYYGNNEYIVNWENDGLNIRNFYDSNGKLRSVTRNPSFYFRPSVTWTRISSSKFGVRYSPTGFIFSDAGPSVYPEEKYLKPLNALVASNLTRELLNILNPTLSFQVGDIERIPVSPEILDKLDKNIPEELINIAKEDWDNFERSWDFKTNPLLRSEFYKPSIEATYNCLRDYYKEITLKSQALEVKNNKMINEIYNLGCEINSDIDLRDITLTCNPYYRYNKLDENEDKEENEGNENNENNEDSQSLNLNLENKFKADTIKEFISYAVGCMFGRYSLDKEGLILVSQGQTVEDYLKHIPEPKFTPVKDNILTIFDDEYFENDIVALFYKFIKLTFSEADFLTNLKFIEQALIENNSSSMSIRDYFNKYFYDDHLKTYAKRPIYWQFTSPKGSFKALIYMHRYTENTVHNVLNDYLRAYQSKLKNKVDSLNLQKENSKDSAKLTKSILKFNTIINELNAYEKDTLFPLASQKVNIDLDDGVKVNYAKFNNAFKKVKF